MCISVIRAGEDLHQCALSLVSLVSHCQVHRLYSPSHRLRSQADLLESYR